MIYTNMPRNCVVFVLPRRQTRPAIYGSQKFDSHEWLTMLVHDVKWKPCNFEWHLCGSLYSTFKTSFKPYAFHNKRFQTLFIDQLVRSKATCSFKKEREVFETMRWNISAWKVSQNVYSNYGLFFLGRNHFRVSTVSQKHCHLQ